MGEPEQHEIPFKELRLRFRNPKLRAWDFSASRGVYIRESSVRLLRHRGNRWWVRRMILKPRSEGHWPGDSV